MIGALERLCVDTTLRAAGIDGVELILRRAWPRSAGHLLLEYADEAGRLAPGQWMDDAERLRRVARQTAAGGGTAHLAACAGSPILLQLDGADRRLTGLRAVLARPGATLVSHRPERRAVVRLPHDGLGPRRDGPAYAKLVPPDRADELMRRSTALAEAAAKDGVRVARVVDDDRSEGRIVTAALPGVSLFEIDDARYLDAVGRAGRALRRFHSMDVAIEPVHDARAEVDVVTGWVERAARLGDVRVMAEHLDAVRRRLLDVDASPPQVVVHRDLYDRQLLIDDEGDVGLIDLDTVATGEPELDVANALSHLRLRELQRARPSALTEAASRAFVEGYGPRGLDTMRLQAYEASATLRLACVYAFRPAWRSLVPELLSRVRCESG